MVGDWDQVLGVAQWQRGINSQNAVFTQGGFNGLGIYVLGQQKLAIVLSVNAFGVGFLLVFGMHLKIEMISINTRDD